MKPGMEWDPARRTWKPVNYAALTPEQLRARREQVDDEAAEVEVQLKALLPIADAQSILNKSVLDLQGIIIDLAKRAPGMLAGLV